MDKEEVGKATDDNGEDEEEEKCDTISSAFNIHLRLF
jgi:hypothetical protein